MPHPCYRLGVTLMSSLSVCPVFIASHLRQDITSLLRPQKEAITPKELENNIDFTKDFIGKVERFTSHISMPTIHACLWQLYKIQCALEPKHLGSDDSFTPYCVILGKLLKFRG